MGKVNALVPLMTLGIDEISKLCENMLFGNNLFAIFGFIIEDNAPESIKIFSGGLSVIKCGNSGEFPMLLRFTTSLPIQWSLTENFQYHELQPSHLLDFETVLLGVRFLVL